MKRILIMSSIIFLISVQGCASLISPWTFNKRANTRFIPVEMWTGAEWDGNEGLTMTPANAVFGTRNQKAISGPLDWTHPITGEKLKVYERINNTTKGVKRQLFTVNPDRTGLAKVFDERPGEATRLFSTQAVIFPLGRWRRGEKRTFRFVEYVNGEPVGREATLHIRRLGFTYKGTRNAFKYDYLMYDASGAIVFHERFIYGPGNSLMYFKNRL